MKYRHDKSFGYPVLRARLDSRRSDDSDQVESDYPGKFFDLTIKLQLDVEQKKFVLNYSFDAPVLWLAEKLNSREVAYFLRIECSDTYFSCVEEAEIMGEIRVAADDLRDIVRVSGFIVAKKSTEIISDQINPEFDTNKFTVKSGMVLGCCPSSKFYVEKDIFRPITSLFEFIESSELGDGEFEVSPDNDRVGILASSEQIKKFKLGIARGAEGKIAFVGSVAFAAVVQMFQALKDDYNTYKDYRWGKALIAKYEERIDGRTDVIRAAQKILKKPISNMNKTIWE